MMANTGTGPRLPTAGAAILAVVPQTDHDKPKSTSHSRACAATDRRGPEGIDAVGKADPSAATRFLTPRGPLRLAGASKSPPPLRGLYGHPHKYAGLP